ncbi:hypothetical protein [Oryza sativa Japonica Group]|uniref:Uncharacterized protein n=1 Tax=Oryza sativa subsp. japonica TaxID=39947 RepID=Q9LGC8_ORYSJ|nr:hypothetical protein [Oryza sativa Japonica Group]
MCMPLVGDTERRRQGTRSGGGGGRGGGGGGCGHDEQLSPWRGDGRRQGRAVGGRGRRTRRQHAQCAETLLRQREFAAPSSVSRVNCRRLLVPRLPPTREREKEE